MKGKTKDIKAMIYFFCKRLPNKPEELTQNRNLRASENLVAPLSIVLTESCINYEH